MRKKTIRGIAIVLLFLISSIAAGKSIPIKPCEFRTRLMNVNDETQHAIHPTQYLQELKTADIMTIGLNKMRSEISEYIVELQK